MPNRLMKPFPSQCVLPYTKLTHLKDTYRYLTGRVVSDKMTRSRVVAVKRKVFHKKYKKVLTRTKRFIVHDNNSLSKLGDYVRFIPVTQPISKRKKWEIKEVVKIDNSTCLQP